MDLFNNFRNIIKIKWFNNVIIKIIIINKSSIKWAMILIKYIKRKIYKLVYKIWKKEILLIAKNNKKSIQL